MRGSRKRPLVHTVAPSSSRSLPGGPRTTGHAGMIDAITQAGTRGRAPARAVLSGCGGWQNFVFDPEVGPILQQAGHKSRPQVADLLGQYGA